jgi:hypothetical protein
VRRDDFRVVLAACVEIVIDTSDAHLFEPAHLLFVHQAERAADVDSHCFPNHAHGVGDLLDFFVRRSAAAVDDAVSDRAGVLGGFGAVNEFFPGEKWIAVNGRRETGRLASNNGSLRGKAMLLAFSAYGSARACRNNGGGL